MAEPEEVPHPIPSECPPEDPKSPNEAQATVVTEKNQKASELMLQAERKAKFASSVIGGLFGRASKFEHAADLYIRAANAFKVAKNYEGSGQAFTEAAKLYQEKLEYCHDAAINFSEAAQVYKKVNPNEAVKCYLQSIDIYTWMGRFFLAAQYYKSIAEVYEMCLVDLEKAVQCYEQAADWYKTEDSKSSANKCLGKVAHICAQLQQFRKAAIVFEDIGKDCLDCTLLKYSAKDYFFKALVCWFCNDRQGVEEKAEEYKTIHPAFDGTRECRLIGNLLQAFDEPDEDKFAEITEEYDSISRIDSWLTAQLLHIKKKISDDLDVN